MYSNLPTCSLSMDRLNTTYLKLVQLIELILPRSAGTRRLIKELPKEKKRRDLSVDIKVLHFREFGDGAVISVLRSIEDRENFSLHSFQIIDRKSVLRNLDGIGLLKTQMPRRRYGTRRTERCEHFGSGNQRFRCRFRRENWSLSSFARSGLRSSRTLIR
ncbi:hypothetical protein Mapa_007052 [Marchantia paleacea]|nr:hypothetical protein Mapa_007052 [Marchantia paleacea]